MDQLHQLIHTLSKTEKRYIKRMASLHVRGDENNYIKLFDLLNDQDEYNESVLQNALQLDRNQFAVTKNYLYNVILDSLESYYANKNVNHELDKQLHRVEILFDKHLIVQAQKIADRIKKRAIELEQFFVLVKVIELELRMVHLSPEPLAEQLKTIYALKEENLIAWDKLLQVNNYKHYYYQITYNALKFGLSNKVTDLEAINEILNKEEIENEDNCKSATALNYLQAIKLRYYNMIQDSEKGLEYSGKQLKLMMEHPKILIPSNLQYISRLYSHCTMCLYAGSIDEFEQYFNEMIGIEVQNKHEEANLFFSRYNLAMQRDLVYLSLNETPKYIAMMQKSLKSDDIRLSSVQQAILFLQAAHLKFIMDQIDDAQDWLNLILNMGNASLRDDMYTVVYIKEMILNFENGNHQYLESRIRAIKRLLSNSNNLNETSVAFIRFFTKVIKCVNSKEQTVLFEQFKAEINTLIQTGEARQLSNFIDVMSWIESKIIKKPILYIMKQKLQINTTDK